MFKCLKIRKNATDDNENISDFAKNEDGYLRKERLSIILVSLHSVGGGGGGHILSNTEL